MPKPVIHFGIILYTNTFKTGDPFLKQQMNEYEEKLKCGIPNFLSKFCQYENTYNHLLFLAIELSHTFQDNDLPNFDYNKGIQLFKNHQISETNQFFIESAKTGHSKSLFFGIHQLLSLKDKIFRKMFYDDYINEYLTLSLNHGLIDAFVRVCIETMKENQYCLLFKFVVNLNHPSAMYWLYKFFNPNILSQIVKQIVTMTSDSY